MCKMKIMVKSKMKEEVIKMMSGLKYVLMKKLPRLYFKGYESINKPTWTDNRNEATEYDILTAQRMIKRLACQSQVVELCIQNPYCFNKSRCSPSCEGKRLKPDTPVSPNEEK